MLFDIIKNNFSTIISTIFLLILAYVIRFYVNYFSRPSKLPGPIPLPVVGNIFQMESDFVATTDKFNKKYGDFYEFYLGNVRKVVISRPDLMEKIWGPTSIKTTKFMMRHAYSEGLDELDLGTKGIVFNRNIESWKINRKFLVQSISSYPFLREAIKLTNKITDEIFEYWKFMEKEGMRVDFSEWMVALGTDIVVTTATGKRMSSTADLFNGLNVKGKKSEVQGAWKIGINFTKSIYTYNESMMFMMLFSSSIRRNLPGFKSLNKTFLDNKDWISNILEDMVSEKRNEIENTPLDKPLEPTILTLLLTTNTERDLNKISVGDFNRPLTDNEIGSVLREVFTGGLDTTSNTMSFLVYYISRDREVYLKMREEVLKVYGTLDNPELTLESFEKLKYFDAVINESIRIFPTLSHMPRAAIEDVDFNGVTIDADTTVYTDFKVLGRNPKYFRDPEKFNPDRFIIDNEPTVKFSNLPFGSGMRICPGRSWALVQLKTFLVKLVSKFDIELVDKNSDLKYKYATTNRPVDLNLYIKTRKN